MGYKEWFIHRSVKSFNEQLQVLNERLGIDRIPELVITGDLKSLSKDLIDLYNKELIYRKNGNKPLINPETIICQKIRHRFTNYDHVSNSLMDSLDSGYLDDCDELNLRSQLMTKLKKIVESIIDLIPCSLQMSNCQVTKQMIIKANDNYLREKQSTIVTHMVRFKCNN
jgi:hypothetical protein